MSVQAPAQKKSVSEDTPYHALPNSSPLCLSLPNYSRLVCARLTSVYA